MKKLISILGIIALIICAFMSSVYATGFKFIATPNATTVNAGDEITVTLSVSNIDAGELGINTFYSVLEFDEEIFEYVERSAKGQNNWSLSYNNISGNEQYGTLLATITEVGVKDDQTIGTISLKVKSGTEGKTGKITFKNVATNDGLNKIYDDDKVITITINKKTDDSGTGSGSGTGTGTGSGSGTGTGTGSGSGTGSGIGSGSGTGTGTGSGSGTGTGTGSGSGTGTGTGSGSGTGTGTGSGSGTGSGTGSGGGASIGTGSQSSGASSSALPQTGINEIMPIVVALIPIVTAVVGYAQYRKYKDIV